MAEEKEVLEQETPETQEAEAETVEKTEEAVPQEETADAAAESEKKGFFHKKKDKKDEKIEDLNDKLMRQMAEFENFRKRTAKEKAAMYEVGAREVIEKLLPIVDNFERGLATIENPEEDPFADGMNKVYKQLIKALEDMGVTAIEAKGQEFDPNLHNAVMHVEDDSLGENIIAQEFQKGYKYKDTVVRHSMVQVAN